MRSRYVQARANVRNPKRRKSLEYGLSFEETVDLWQQGCHYCGRDITSETGCGLDRKDNSRGYTTDNVLPCCGQCNIVRNSVFSVQEMEIAMKAVLEYRRSHNDS